jgi:8-oxo-dGTP pyrophosphatase MutT (NUDIX family)
MKTNYCANCGREGHIYRRCTDPITSLGIILFRIRNKAPQYLMICRKDTLGYVEFIRGKYNIENYKYIYSIFGIMTRKERLGLLENDFDTLWNKLWMNKNLSNYHNEYETSKKKFNILKKGIIVDKETRKYLDLSVLNNEVKINYEKPEWGFPKGRRNLRENDIECAKREFKEETLIKEEEYNMIEEIGPLTEIFLGTNNIRYKHVYYIAESNNDRVIQVDKTNFQQISEISDIKWLDFEEAYNSIRIYNKEKRDLLNKLNCKILSFKNINTQSINI